LGWIFTDFCGGSLEDDATKKVSSCGSSSSAKAHEKEERERERERINRIGQNAIGESNSIQIEDILQLSSSSFTSSKKVAKKTIDDVCNARARDKVNDSAAHLSFRGGCGAPHFYLCNARCTNEEHQTPASFF